MKTEEEETAEARTTMEQTISPPKVAIKEVQLPSFGQGFMPAPLFPVDMKTIILFNCLYYDRMLSPNQMVSNISPFPAPPPFPTLPSAQSQRLSQLLSRPTPLI
eukprot:TRINITY_DN523_c0_g1_i9.p1 TRINITY_DN523_c0_g1~~TRINITY_DN523_c0_g1_i9.p1  ORF type:complete len:104 (-),score=22.33 TRINITY_DN523_c0_g1_i9:10-321(-)